MRMLLDVHALAVLLEVELVLEQVLRALEMLELVLVEVPAVLVVRELVLAEVPAVLVVRGHLLLAQCVVDLPSVLHVQLS